MRLKNEIEEWNRGDKKQQMVQHKGTAEGVKNALDATLPAPSSAQARVRANQTFTLMKTPSAALWFTQERELGIVKDRIYEQILFYSSERSAAFFWTVPDEIFSPAGSAAGQYG